MDKVVLQHHKQGEKALSDYVINVLPTPAPTKATIETIKTILETADEATSLEPVLSKIVAVIVKFCKEPNSNEEVCGWFKTQEGQAASNSGKAPEGQQPADNSGKAPEGLSKV